MHIDLLAVTIYQHIIDVTFVYETRHPTLRKYNSKCVSEGEKKERKGEFYVQVFCVLCLLVRAYTLCPNDRSDEITSHIVYDAPARRPVY